MEGSDFKITIGELILDSNQLKTNYHYI